MFFTGSTFREVHSSLGSFVQLRALISVSDFAVDGPLDRLSPKLRLKQGQVRLNSSLDSRSWSYKGTASRHYGCFGTLDIVVRNLLDRALNPVNILKASSHANPMHLCLVSTDP